MSILFMRSESKFAKMTGVGGREDLGGLLSIGGGGGEGAAVYLQGIKNHKNLKF
jgi:hypothetical protein